jgi:predicted DNA-binding transcriptional regulator YafY
VGPRAGAFLQPLALTLHEATTLFLAARMLAKASDEHDTELIGAFVKLASILPPVLAEHIQATVDAFAETPRNETFTRVFRVLAEGWANRRVIDIEYDAGVYEPGRGSRRARVRPWAIEPSALTHALYLIGWDESRAGRRTFKVERILSASLTPDTFDDEQAATGAHDMLRAWDVIADEEPVEVVIRFLRRRRQARRRDALAPQPGARPATRRHAALARPRGRPARDPHLDPGLGRRRRGPRAARAARVSRRGAGAARRMYG